MQGGRKNALIGCAGDAFGSFARFFSLKCHLKRGLSRIRERNLVVFAFGNDILMRWMLFLPTGWTAFAECGLYRPSERCAAAVSLYCDMGYIAAISDGFSLSRFVFGLL